MSPIWSGAGDPPSLIGGEEATQRSEPQSQSSQSSSQTAPVSHPADERIESLESSEAWSKADHPDHAKVIEELRGLYAEKYPAQKVPDVPPVGDAARIAGVTRPDLPGQIKETWSEDAEASYYHWGAIEHIPAATLQRVIDRYSDWLTLGGRQWATVENPADEAEWRVFFTDQGLTEFQQDSLIDWYRKNGGAGTGGGG
jgi:hypothetical protein